MQNEASEFFEKELKEELLAAFREKAKDMKKIAVEMVKEKFEDREYVDKEIRKIFGGW